MAFRNFLRAHHEKLRKAHSSRTRLSCATGFILGAHPLIAAGLPRRAAAYSITGYSAAAKTDCVNYEAEGAQIRTPGIPRLSHRALTRSLRCITSTCPKCRRSQDRTMRPRSTGLGLFGGMGV